MQHFIILFALSLITTFSYAGAIFYALIHKYKQISFILDYKLPASEVIIKNQIRLPKEVFAVFEEFIKKTRRFLYLTLGGFIAIIIIFLFISFAFVLRQRLLPTNMIIILAVPFISFLISLEIIVRAILRLVKIKRVIQIWQEENLKFSLYLSDFEKPKGFDEFKNIILFENLEIKSFTAESEIKNFKRTRISQAKKSFLKNKYVDETMLIYFLLLDYKRIEINGVKYSADYYIYAIKKILNHEFNLS
ncbi:MAG0920 family protein [Mycoplasma phocoeninasale]|uniref:MAG0920 family protein n=1 Tax=Mycoplasma phocoeninasale TaxID=2726117 RepID=UPI0019685008|nr:hypothetical protein [Mycoplasma phocoeninasale]MBN0970998.1 hypothetical protein [Mycoplasma phocoeninasale]